MPLTPQGQPLTDTYLYSRVSTKKQLTGMGLELQDQNLKACLAEHPEWTLQGSFRDLGISAFKGANRLTGEFGDFLQLVRVGKVRPGSVLIRITPKYSPSFTSRSKGRIGSRKDRV